MSLEKVPDFMAGSKMFIKPRMYQIWSESLPPATKRVNDYIFESPVVKDRHNQIYYSGRFCG